jgi:hypothetical protein
MAESETDHPRLYGAPWLENHPSLLMIASGWTPGLSDEWRRASGRAFASPSSHSSGGARREYGEEIATAST